MQEILTNSQAELLWLAGIVEMANMAEINEVSFITQEQTKER